MGQRDDRTHDRRRRPVLVHRRDEGLVDLQDVDIGLLKLGERGVPCAEVVDGELDPEVPKAVQVVAGDTQALQQRGLGDLHGDPVRGDFAATQGLAQCANRIVLPQRARGQVDRQRATRRAPLCAPAAGLLQYPAVHRRDKGTLLGDRDELVGREQSESGTFPADEGLGADHLLIGQRHNRLVEDPQLVAGDCPA